MELVTPDMIPYIDSYAEEKLNIPSTELMRRAAGAVRDVLKKTVPEGSCVLILAGKGNNGGDGYALATLISDTYEVTVVDVFSAGQRSDAGRYFYDAFLKSCGRLISGLSDLSCIDGAELIVDAVFGTGMSGNIPRELYPLIEKINKSGKRVLAIDVPLGVCAYDGSVEERALRAASTVQLSFMKVGTLSYPAREYLGEVHYSDLDLANSDILSHFEFDNFLTDEPLAKALLPKRAENTNQGSFGKALLVTGSDKYEGAGRLTLEAALRGGAGIVGFTSSRSLREKMIKDFPEAIYYSFEDEDGISADEISALSAKHTSTLVGSGSGVSENLYKAVSSLIRTEGGPLVIDADAINSLSKYGSCEELKSAKRSLILTPHPLEFSRLIGLDVKEINSARLKVAKRFALEYNCILVLKGAGTVITDGKRVYINSSGNSALAKGGSGDALSGLLVSLLAFSSSPIEAAALAVYIHGRAGDNLAEEYSEYGVTPSDLPKEMAKVVRSLEKD